MIKQEKQVLNFNPRQNEAINCLDGPLLIIAGAGSGKTRVLIERISNIILQGKANPYEIMAVTFTNKAAQELKERIIAKIGEMGAFVRAGTFHSLCAKILRKHAKAIGYGQNFIIYDTDDKLRLLKSILKRNGTDYLLLKPKTVGSIISKLKNKLIFPDDFAHKLSAEIEDSSLLQRNDLIKDIYEEYQEELRRCNAFDFDDLLCMTIKLFEENEDIKFEYQNMIKYILVDEYQDTNFVQSKLTDILSEVYNNICVVGDDDQSIYSWRGADINNILQFKKTHKNCKDVRLEQNYRSSGNILNSANAVIAHNSQRLGKKLFTEFGLGEKVKFIYSNTDKEEGSKIASIISGLIKKKTNLNEIAVLYRTNMQSRIIEEFFRRTGIPYAVVGGMKFYDRKEIKDFTAYLKLLINNKDNISFERIINFPTRKIGKQSQIKIKEYAYKEELSFMEAAVKVEQISDLKDSAKSHILKFVNMFEECARLLQKDGVESMCQYVLDKSSLKDYYSELSTKNDSSQLDNIYEFLNGILEYDEENKSETNILIEYLESISLLSDIDSYNSNMERVTLLTVHASKGLEFENVIISGLCDNLFPLIRQNDFNSNLEEERRLFYVASTRAKKRLYLSAYKIRQIFTGFEVYSPSRFLNDIPEEYTDRTNFNIDSSDYINNNTKFYPNKSKKSNKKEKKKAEYENFKKGDWVISKQFGEGKVLSVEGNGVKINGLIDFEDFGMKKLLFKYANLSKCDF